MRPDSTSSHLKAASKPLKRESGRLVLIALMTNGKPAEQEAMASVCLDLRSLALSGTTRVP